MNRDRNTSGVLTKENALDITFSHDKIEIKSECDSKTVNQNQTYSKGMCSLDSDNDDVGDTNATYKYKNNEQDTHVLSSIQTNIKILYGIITTLVLFIILGLWIIKMEVNTLRNECLGAVPTRTLDIQNYGIIVDKIDFQNVLFASSQNKRTKRESHLRKSLQKEVSFISN